VPISAPAGSTWSRPSGRASRRSTTRGPPPRRRRRRRPRPPRRKSRDEEMDYSELNLIGSSSPHIRTKAGTNSIMGEVLIALAPALCFAIYKFGWRALANTLVSAAGCCLFEYLYRYLMKKNNTVGDQSAAVTGVLIVFVCPVTIPYWILLVGDF